MRSPMMAFFTATLASCSATAPVPADLSRRLAEAPEGVAPRLGIASGALTHACVPLGPGSLPPAVRVTIDAVAPRGKEVFRGREWGPRGTGYRIEKHYRDRGTARLRSALIAEDGRVLERAHSVPFDEVPENVLETALGVGPKVRDMMIVSGPEREEYWSCFATDRIGRTFRVTIWPDGSLRSAHRTVRASVEI